MQQNCATAAVSDENILQICYNIGKTAQQNGQPVCLIDGSIGSVPLTGEENVNRKKMDECLVRTQSGDKAAYSLFYAETAKGVFAFLYGYYRNRARTEEGVQETYYKALKNIGQYRAGSDARAWLLQIAKNIALNDIRRAKREEILPAEKLEPLRAEEPPDGSVFDAMNRALDETERQIVTLHVLWGYKHREIAAMLNMPLGTVTSKYKISVTKMKKYLKEGQ